MWIRHHHWQLPLIILPSTCRYPLFSNTGLVCNIEYPSKTDLKVKSREISFVISTRFDNPIAVKCCSEHDNITAMLCLAFQNDFTTEARIIGERDFARWEFKMSFGRISYITQQPGSGSSTDPRHNYGSVWDASTHTPVMMKKLLCTDQ